MIATIPSAILHGVDGRPITVEVQVSNGLPVFSVVGLPDAACREARDRVRAAFVSSRLSWPMRRITVNLAPSGVRKAGPGLDLPIAVGLLVASGALTPEEVAGHGFVGEVGLDGSVRAVEGIVPLVEAVRAERVVVPAACAPAALYVAGERVLAATHLRSVVDALRGGGWLDAKALQAFPGGLRAPGERGREPQADLADVRGQRMGRWALEVAAAGGHHLLMVGPPGCGKSMLALRLPGLLPPLDPGEVAEVTRIHSAAGVPLPRDGLVRRAPLRAPHHCLSASALLGGSSTALRPGEISLATNGVLFLDEIGEFAPNVLDALREPLERGTVHLHKGSAGAVLPARFLLVAAMNPCPCGEGMGGSSCRCSPVQRRRYLRRLSGPMLDRFDLQVALARPSSRELMEASRPESSASVARRVARARDAAAARGFRSNGEIPAARLDQLVPLGPTARAHLDRALRAGMLSGRGVQSVRRVACTLADLSGSETAQDEHVVAALALRCGGPASWARQAA